MESQVQMGQELRGESKDQLKNLSFKGDIKT